MWPFTRTLSERYCKLVKLIKSIDSHFQLTEDKEDSLRLHLPNYKGNQTMDFHIYLMEPFLFINLVTEIDGEKISTVNSYPQDMDQQDIFNMAMSSNLQRVHQVMAAKNMDEETNDITIEEEETIQKEENKVLRIINVWPLLEFAKAHGKMLVGEFANKETGEVFKACIFTKPDDGTRTFVAFSTKLGELTPKQIVDMKNELQVVQLESGNYSLCKKDSGRNDVDLEERLAADTWTDEYGAEYSVDKKVLKRVPKEITDYSILEGTEIIGDAAFSNCQDIVYVSIPNSITKIGHYAFAGCKKIFSLIIPRGVKSIGDGAFMNCETLKSLRLSAGLVSISDDAFDGCNNLNTIFVPVEEKNRFEAMLSKFDVNIAEYNNDNVSALDEILSGLLDESGVLYSKDGKTVFTHTKKLSSYTIKTGTEIINAKAFSPIDGVDNDNMSLKEIILPNSITTIWDSAFAYNEGLQEISLPSSIKTIGRDVFKGCKSLRSIRIPHGTRTKFERLLPEWNDILVEKSKIVSDTLSNFELPDGSIYNGGCLRNPFGSIVLNGIGSLTYPNGDKYKGNFQNGRPYGWGIYYFQNGHKYKGYFDERPKGIGYLNENYDMAVGNFYDGRLHGWAICYRNRIFKFGYWENGKLFKDETNKTLWVRCEISNLRTQYNGNLIQISQGHEFIRFGIPERTISMGTNNPNTPKWPAIGFEFFKDGTVKVGEIRNNSSGGYILCKINGTMELGHWKDNVKDADKTLTDFQEPIDLYEVDGLDVWHCYR